MVNTKHIRAGKEFINLSNKLKIELQPFYKKKISDREITNGLAKFVLDEGLNNIFVRRVKRNRRGGLF